MPPHNPLLMVAFVFACAIVVVQIGAWLLRWALNRSWESES